MRNRKGRRTRGGYEKGGWERKEKEEMKLKEQGGKQGRTEEANRGKERIR